MMRRRRFNVLPVLVVLLLAAVGGRFAKEAPAPPPVAVDQLAPDGSSPDPVRRLTLPGMYLIPFDGTPVRLLRAAGRRLRSSYGVSVTVLPRRRTERRFVDAERQQVDASRLNLFLGTLYGAPKAGVGVVAVTDLDIFYAGEPSWHWAFAAKDAGYGTISVARMDPRNTREHVPPGRLQERLDKFVLRYAGDLFFRIPRGGSERSVMRGILGRDDLDAATYAFCPSDPRAIRTC